MTATTRPTYTADAIRAMDGLALTRAAQTLGLAPPRVITVGDAYTGEYRGCWYANAEGDPLESWAPHVDIDTALAVFRTLRLSGWGCWQESFEHRGIVGVFGGPPQSDYEYGATCYWGTGHGDTEATALLRCSVLAMASMKP